MHLLTCIKCWCQGSWKAWRSRPPAPSRRWWSSPRWRGRPSGPAARPSARSTPQSPCSWTRTLRRQPTSVWNWTLQRVHIHSCLPHPSTYSISALSRPWDQSQILQKRDYRWSAPASVWPCCRAGTSNRVRVRPHINMESFKTFKLNIHCSS